MSSGHKVAFQKWEATGNDFLFVDAESQGLGDNLPRPEAVRKVCHRQEGLGADGVVLYTVDEHGATMKIINADGSKASMCGNALRCLAQILFHQTGRAKHLVQLTNRQVTVSYLEKGQSSVVMGPAQALDAHELFSERAELSQVLGHSPSYLVSFGNPHLVVPVDKIPTNWRELGAAVQEPSDQILGTGGINCGFVERQPDDEGVYQLRVFERGVGETQSCGSGACAASVVLEILNQRQPPHRLELSGGILTLDRQDKDVVLSGPACKEYEGAWEISD